MILNQKKEKLRIIIGLGKTGLACARYFFQKKIPFIINDSRDNPPGLTEARQEFPGIEIVLGGFDEKILEQAEELVISPGVALLEPAIAKQIARGVLIIGDIELFAEQVRAPVIAITGSNGKSTVTSLVGEMAKYSGLDVKVGGNIGVPVLDFLNTKKQAELYVLELSSFQLETTHNLRPKAAVLLNICPDHLDRYASMQEYITAKQRVYKNCDVAIINRDDSMLPPFRPFGPPSPARGEGSSKVISFGLDTPDLGHFGILLHQGESYLAFGNECLLSIDSLKIKSKHYIANALAALALGYAVGLPMPAMIKALKEFQGLPHRCQWFLNRKGIDWYNDSKATNVGAALAAIQGLGELTRGKIILIAGGISKENDFSKLYQPLLQYGRMIILLGQDKNKIAEDFCAQGLDKKIALIKTEDLEQAIKKASQEAQPGDIILLSPFCASLDMFNNFEERGTAFMEMARAQA